MNAEPINILLVEDNPADAALTQVVFAETKVANCVHVVTNGTDALRRLRQQDEFRDTPRPDLVLLDLNLPGTHGRQVLESIKRDPELKRIPVVILTSSEAERDIVAAYEAAANCYISKPMDLDGFRTIVSVIEEFWFSVVKLPPVASGSARQVS